MSGSADLRASASPNDVLHRSVLSPGVPPTSDDRCLLWLSLGLGRANLKVFQELTKAKRSRQPVRRKAMTHHPFFLARVHRPNALHKLAVAKCLQARPGGDCRTSAKNELFSCFWTIKTACPPFKNACTGILERRLFQNGQSPTAPSGTQAPCGPGPGDKSPGYCHRSLRDAFWPAPQATILSLSQLWLKKRFY